MLMERTPKNILNVSYGGSLREKQWVLLQRKTMEYILEEIIIGITRNYGAAKVFH